MCERQLMLGNRQRQLWQQLGLHERIGGIGLKHDDRLAHDGRSVHDDKLSHDGKLVHDGARVRLEQLLCNDGHW